MFNVAAAVAEGVAESVVVFGDRWLLVLVVFVVAAIT